VLQENASNAIGGVAVQGLAEEAFENEGVVVLVHKPVGFELENHLENHRQSIDVPRFIAEYLT
jgi:hypothetical protein